jgi:hypothetical protein
MRLHVVGTLPYITIYRVFRQLKSMLTSVRSEYSTEVQKLS